MDLDKLPHWIQWIIIFLCAIPVCVVWSWWDLIKDKAKRAGENSVSKLFKEKPNDEPLQGIYPRTIAKLMGLTLLVICVFIFSEPTLDKIFTTLKFGVPALCVIGFLKKNAVKKDTKQNDISADSK